MPYRRPVVCLVAFAALSLPAAASAGTLKGRVTDEITGAPLSNITVGAGPVGFGLREYTQTGVDGSFAIDGLDVALAPGTSITGKVTDSDGQPLAGVCVTAWAPLSGGIDRKAAAVTSAAGIYTLVGLTPGTRTGSSSTSGASTDSPRAQGWSHSGSIGRPATTVPLRWLPGAVKRWPVWMACSDRWRTRRRVLPRVRATASCPSCATGRSLLLARRSPEPAARRRTRR
jgi:hypothetical protein